MDSRFTEPCYCGDCWRCGQDGRIDTDGLVFDPAWQQGAHANIALAEERVKTLEPGQKFRLEDLEGEVH